MRISKKAVSTICAALLLFSGVAPHAQIGPVPASFPLRIGGCTPWVTIYTNGLTASAGSNYGTWSVRANALTVTGGGNQVRVQFIAPSDSTMRLDHQSIGKASTAPDTAATPVQLLVSGGSGLLLTANQTVLTDPANLVVANGDNLVVIADNNATSNITFAGGGDGEYEKIATASYNQSSVSGFSLVSRKMIFNQIDARYC